MQRVSSGGVLGRLGFDHFGNVFKLFARRRDDIVECDDPDEVPVVDDGDATHVCLGHLLGQLDVFGVALDGDRVFGHEVAGFHSRNVFVVRNRHRDIPVSEDADGIARFLDNNAADALVSEEFRDTDGRCVWLCYNWLDGEMFNWHLSVTRFWGRPSKDEA